MKSLFQYHMLWNCLYWHYTTLSWTLSSWQCCLWMELLERNSEWIEQKKGRIKNSMVFRVLCADKWERGEKNIQVCLYLHTEITSKVFSKFSYFCGSWFHNTYEYHTLRQFWKFTDIHNSICLVSKWINNSSFVHTK